ncbi:MAG: HAD family phosphatase [Sedimentisphaerales bacterium]|nr:HAD family phosphatase [Sedimentisphaerales bacterium]
MNTMQWGVIFDIDGTMVDNKDYHERAWVELCRRYGINLTAEAYRTHIHARTNDKIIPDLFGANISAEKVTCIALEKETIYRDLYRPHLQPLPGLVGLLDELKARGIPCAAASNSPAGNVNLVIDGLTLRHYFISVICADDVSHGKPDPEIFLTAAKHLGLPPQRCIIFEDSAPGFEAARRAGCPYIVIAFGAEEEHLARSDGAAAVYHDFTDITTASIENYLPTKKAL